MTPAWPFVSAHPRGIPGAGDALKPLHLAVITLWGDDLIDTEILTREYILSKVEGLRAALVVVCELDDMMDGVWRRRLWVRMGC